MMTTTEGAKTRATAAEANDRPHSVDADTFREEAAIETTSSSSKGIIATLTGAAMQLATSIRPPAPAKGAATSPGNDNATDSEKGADPPRSEPSLPANGVMEAADDFTVGSKIAMMDNASLSLEAAVNQGDVVSGCSDQTMPSTNDNDDDKKLVEEKVNTGKITVDALSKKKLGEDLDIALDTLQEKISVVILANRKNQESAANLNLDEDEKQKSNDAYTKLRDVAVEAYHSLVRYGSSLDLSSRGSTEDKGAAFLSEVRRSRLLYIGRILSTTIRNNPTLFNDMASDEKTDGEFVSFEAKKSKVVAGGYAQAIAARLVLLNYINTCCSTGRPHLLHQASVTHGDGGRPSLQDLIFGLKLFSRAGRAILQNNRNDARASYDSLLLAASCFNAVSVMAASGNAEASGQLKGLLDEAFDVISMLSNAALLFGEVHGGDGKSSENGVIWQQLVLNCLVQADAFVDNHCNLFKTNDDKSQPTSKLATLQRFMRSLAKLCYRHGSQFVKLKDYENAINALQIAIKSTNSCLSETRRALEQGTNRKVEDKQMLHNLDSKLVAISIETFYLLGVAYQSSGEEKKALTCLDLIEAHMEEQHDHYNELYSML